MLSAGLLRSAARDAGPWRTREESQKISAQAAGPRLSASVAPPQLSTILLDGLHLVSTFSLNELAMAAITLLPLLYGTLAVLRWISGTPAHHHAACNPMCAGLQPYVRRPAALCAPACNPMCAGLQPFALRPATLCAPACNH